MTVELSKFYLITPDFSGNLKNYLNSLENSLRQGIKLVQLRSKQLSREDYKKLASNILQLVHSYNGKLILNAPIDLLTELNADGIHLPSADYSNESIRPLSKHYLLSVACHNEIQLKQAEKIQADLAVLCPVFATPSSPQGIPLGWENFAKLAKRSKLPIYALGGLNLKDYEQARKHGAYGLAAKRALWDL